MKKYLPILLIFCFCAQTSWCQDDSAAREHYQKAEAAYLAGQWAESLQHLQQAEVLLGRKTPKVQFLKVIVYEKLALEDISYLEPALAETRTYLQMQDQLPPLHQKYSAIARQIESNLPGQAQTTHHARVQQKLLEEKIAWQMQANKMRFGFAAALPNKNWMGTELGVILGTRSRFWVLGLSTMTGSDLILDDDFNVKMANKLAARTDGHIIKSTLMHIGYFQGIRVMPRERDLIKPFIGFRALYHGEYSSKYEAKNQQQPNPDKEVLDNIRGYGLDPGDFYQTKTNFHAGLSLDIVIGAMLHLGNTTLFTGMDLINSNRLQFGVAFKIK